MVKACQDAGLPLWVAFYRRALPRFLKIKELVEAGTLGDIRSVVINLYMPPPTDGHEPDWKFTPKISGGGKFIDMAVHTLDFLDYLLGPIQNVSGLATSHSDLYAAEDHVVANFQFESGALGVGDWYFTNTDHLDETTLVGTEGQLSFSTFSDDPLRLVTANGIQQLTIGNPPHVHQPLIQAIVNELNGGAACVSTGISGGRTTRITDIILGNADV
jgi:predicted dehydrogenase